MLFNSAAFLIFLPIVLWVFHKVGSKNRLHILLLASYIFYGWWNPKFLLLIVGSTLLDYYCGLKIATLTHKRKWFLGLSIVANLGVLCAFKYFNFFLDTLSGFGLGPYDALHIILPVGISFYTFQSMSYSIDVYRGERAAETHPIAFATYIAFFPQLVAGPIERSSTILPQLKNLTSLKTKNLKSGFLLSLWGFFKKVVVADGIAAHIEPIFSHPTNHFSFIVFIAVLGFAIQILADFSGYTDIARGVARMFGVHLSLNFINPYLAKNPVDLWKRWHITLSQWFRDYVYIPLGGNRKGKTQMLFNLGLTFTLSGLWHGASWNFVIWGIYHGFWVIIWHLIKHKVKLPNPLGVIATFFITLVGWVFFRADSWTHSLQILQQLCFWNSTPNFKPEWTNAHIKIAIQILLLAFLSLMMLWVEAQQEKKSWYLRLINQPQWVWILIPVTLLLMCWYLGTYNQSPFLYFQF